MNYLDFISKDKSLLIAPAGYGKTHAIAECLAHSSDNEKQLILTHTHAGIASIKEKVRKLNISTYKYHIETITGFAQKFTLAFYCGSDIPPQEDSTNYYPFIIQKASELFDLEAVRRTIQYSYHGLFVDEYQDCTIIQHQMIMTLSQLLPTHILGDPMQGIFDFAGTLVNFNYDLNDFEEVEPLNIPWRWNNANNSELGEELGDIRAKLQTGSTIHLNSYDSIESVICNENDWYKPRTEYRNYITELLSEESLLLIHPISSSIEPRIKILKSFNNRLSLLESIDAGKFYSLSLTIDNWDIDSIVLLVRKLSYELFNKTGLDSWFNENGFKRKTKEEDKRRLEGILILVDELQEKMNYSKLASVVRKIMDLPDIKCYRKDLVFSICRALIIAETEGRSVYEGMVSHKNIIRRVGRKIYGKCIGTTLLTKGLEFDTVAVLNVHRFENYKHFYVAITRACKRLVIFSELNRLRLS